MPGGNPESEWARLADAATRAHKTTGPDVTKTAIRATRATFSLCVARACVTAGAEEKIDS